MEEIFTAGGDSDKVVLKDISKFYQEATFEISCQKTVPIELTYAQLAKENYKIILNWNLNFAYTFPHPNLAIPQPDLMTIHLTAHHREVC